MTRFRDTGHMVQVSVKELFVRSTRETKMTTNTKFGFSVHCGEIKSDKFSKKEPGRRNNASEGREAFVRGGGCSRREAC